NFFKSKIIVLIVTIYLVAVSQVCVYSQEPFLRNRESNPNYEQGDWKSYSVARYITSITVGHQYVYFGTRQSGITRYDQFQNRWDFPWTTSNGLADNEIWALAFDFDTGYLWCASHTAISYYHPTARRWTNYFKDEFGLPMVDEVESIRIESNKIFFKTQAGRLYETMKFGSVILVADTNFSKGRNRTANYPHFFMTNGYLFDPEGIVEDFHFRSAKVEVAYEDNWGNYWIGTDGLGAGKGDRRSLLLEMLDFGLINASVHAMTFHEGVLWIGGIKNFGANRGITAWDLSRATWHYYDQRDISALRSDKIYAITPDGDNLWFSTGYGLTRYAPKNNSWKTFDNFDGLSDNQIYDTVVDDSSIWVGTANGIDRILKKNLTKKDSLKIERISPGNLTIVEVYDLELMENLLWAGTDGGIYIYDTTKREGGFSAEIEGPLDRVVTTISRYGNEIWFGSSAGIDVYDIKKKQWLGVPEGRFFPNTPINRILATKDAVWAATNQGVLKYNRKSKSWRKFTTEDGLINNRVNTILLDGDYIWFGTDRGLTQFYWNDPNRVD
ncbi:MAG: two-component regulator propeller domain-containing protein, partial [bacterium]